MQLTKGVSIKNCSFHSKKYRKQKKTLSHSCRYVNKSLKKTKRSSEKLNSVNSKPKKQFKRRFAAIKSATLACKSWKCCARSKTAIRNSKNNSKMSSKRPRVENVLLSLKATNSKSGYWTLNESLPRAKKKARVQLQHLTWKGSKTSKQEKTARFNKTT